MGPKSDTASCSFLGRDEGTFIIGVVVVFSPNIGLRLGMSSATKLDEFSEKCYGGGGGSLSIQKIILQILGTLNRVF